MALFELLRFRREYHKKIQGVPQRELIREESKLIGTAILVIVTLALAALALALWISK